MNAHKQITALVHDAKDGWWLRFAEPECVVEARRTEEVLPAVARVEELVRGGLFAAGCLSYEASPAFDPALRVRPPGEFPLCWFGLFRKVERLAALPAPEVPAEAPESWQHSVTREQFTDAIARIKEHIFAGDTYQVNYTFRMQAPFAGDAYGLFATLSARQKSKYAAFLDLGRFAVCSASPELFFTLDQGALASLPMKGTAGRGRWPEEDRLQALWLHNSSKNRAENVMIVDMIRNDMGRVAERGTVEVPELFTVERYPTVLQMTSRVTARTGRGLSQVLAALFPCASITGAPKVSTMEIISELETTPRGLYTGAVGFALPEGRVQFNVAIRTVTVDRRCGSAEYGVGGGILWYSDADDEYEECRIKAGVLRRRAPQFRLLESLLWTPYGGFWLLSRHLDRLGSSAGYFGFPLDRDEAEKRLAGFAAGLPPRPHKVRLTLAESGEMEITAGPAPEPSSGPVRVRLAPNAVHSSDCFLFHKTTRREVYEKAKARVPDADDVILVNEKGQATESAIANLAARIRGRLVTPPLSCGLLAGTLREEMIQSGELSERVLTPDDLRTADALFLLNSVRGLRPAVLLPD
ncbi:MAG: aminodeoxychorismate synthase component I [Thermodesulfobacteriota bacterium]